MKELAVMSTDSQRFYNWCCTSLHWFKVFFFLYYSNSQSRRCRRLGNCYSCEIRLKHLMYYICTLKMYIINNLQWKQLLASDRQLKTLGFTLFAIGESSHTQSISITVLNSEQPLLQDYSICLNKLRDLISLTVPGFDVKFYWNCFIECTMYIEIHIAWLIISW